VAVPYDDADVCTDAGRLACQLVDAALAGRAMEEAWPPADLTALLAGFAKAAAARLLPVQDRALAARARECGIPVSVLAGRMLALGQGRFQQRVSATKTSMTNIVGNDLAANKDYARRIMTMAGLPVPRYVRVHSQGDAIEAARRIGYPVVVKPNNGKMGQAVSVGVTGRQQVRDAYRLARQFDRSVLVEELIPGADYRMLVINGRLEAAAWRVPAHVVGDGIHSVSELVDMVNADPRRGEGPTSSWTRIVVDERSLRLLADAGHALSSVPATGEVVYLRRNANTSDGGTAEDVTDIVHPDNREIAERAARAIGLDIAGVDFLTVDISRSLWETGGVICEINSRPGIRKHLWPAVGKRRDVLTPILDMLFPADRPRRIPVVAVTGTGDRRRMADVVTRLLVAGGRNAGLVTEGQVLRSGSRPGQRRPSPEATRMALLDPDLDAVVLDVPPREMRRHGLGCDGCDIAIVVNDPAAEGGALTARETLAIRAVARSARQLVCIRADDPCREAVAGDAGGARLVAVPVARTGARGRPASVRQALAYLRPVAGALAVPTPVIRAVLDGLRPP
jgi:cyanophycin synthetase